MPRISEFYGVGIYMYFNEDHGIPHFHAIYGSLQASFDIETSAIIEGRLPRSVKRRVRKWARLHRAELLANWTRARSGRALAKIQPLP